MKLDGFKSKRDAFRTSKLLPKTTLAVAATALGVVALVAMSAPEDHPSGVTGATLGAVAGSDAKVPLEDRFPCPAHRALFQMGLLDDSGSMKGVFQISDVASRLAQLTNLPQDGLELLLRIGKASTDTSPEGSVNLAATLPVSVTPESERGA